MQNIEPSYIQYRRVCDTPEQLHDLEPETMKSSLLWACQELCEREKNLAADYNMLFGLVDRVNTIETEAAEAERQQVAETGQQILQKLTDLADQMKDAGAEPSLVDELTGGLAGVLRLGD